MRACRTAQRVAGVPTPCDAARRPIHALSIVAKTPQQWESSGGAIDASPKCMGGSQR